MKTGEVIAITSGAVALTALAVYLLEHKSTQTASDAANSMQGGLSINSDANASQIHSNVQSGIMDLLNNRTAMQNMLFSNSDTGKQYVFSVACANKGVSPSTAGNYQNYSFPGIEQYVRQIGNNMPGMTSQSTGNSSNPLGTILQFGLEALPFFL